MSLANFWRTRRPIANSEPADVRDTYHAYITRHSFVRGDDDEEEFVVETNYGELKLCENINMRRAPIATHRVEEVSIREPYNHCEKCKSDIAWLEKMKFGTVVKL